MPHKRNPAARRARAGGALQAVAALPAVLAAAMATSTSAPPAPGRPSGSRCATRSACTGGAAAALREALEGLEVDAERMRANLDAPAGC